MRRREFIQSLTGALGAGLLGATVPIRLARAALAPRGRRFLFVNAQGGWDPLAVFAPLFDSPSVDMELGAQPMEIGRMRLVDHPTRPSVRRFFENWHERCLVLNGLSVRSVAHETCVLLSLSGNSSGAAPDWATRIAADVRDQYTLPHLVLSGPSVAGELGTATARTGQSGQLDGLLSGAILNDSDLATARPTAAAERIIDRFLARRTAAVRSAAKTAREQTVLTDLDSAVDRARALKGERYELNFAPGGSIGTQVDTAVKALSKGIARCATISPPVSWDTHADNAQQGPLFEGLFAGLDSLMQTLQNTPGSEEATLLDETVVVVMSEMGRTPKFNGTNGRDHWPYTSVLVMGPGVTGDRVVGGYDALYHGLNVDPGSAETRDTASPLSVEVLGATLLQLAGVDPAEALPAASPLSGALL